MEEVTSASSPPPALEIASHLPLQLIKSEIIPPAPTRSDTASQPTADFLPDFSGHSWIAYGASSLLVISHFPHPSSEAETKIGPIYRQVIELSPQTGDYVSAVAWSRATPSVGELAVALGDSIVLLTCNDDETSSSSFCWSQTAILVQSMKVEAIQWTGSGDGIISGGIEVVMWRRKEESWEIAWSFKPRVPQALISTTWSADGFSATAPWSEVQVRASSSPSNDATKCVLVYQGDSHSIYPQAELHHPMPVRMIQWRPSTGKPSSRPVRHALRPVLLTCCLDGAVRLWGEIDDGKTRRAGKDNSDQKVTKLSFCVIAVIEVNQTLSGTLGFDIFVSWAMEVEGVAVIGDEVCYYSCLDDLQHDTTGSCEWLIGFGPKTITTLWSVHCLDDFAPVRFPRVTLWKKQDLASFEMEASQLLVPKVFMTRTRVSGPPVICSVVQLSSTNSFAWTQLYSQASTTIEGKSASGGHTESPLTDCLKGVLAVEGHTGKFLQIAFHPFSFEVELAASLDGNGMLIFWSFSTFFNSHIGLPTSTPSLNICGKASFSDHSPNYTCLSWAPTLLGKDQVLLMGHADGIDCFMVKTPKNNEEKVDFHSLCSIPFRIEGHEQGLSRVCSIPLPSSCSGNFVSSKFLLVALWMDNFQALSWEVTIHSYDSQGSCLNEHLQTFESYFSGKRYSVSVDPRSSVFPVPHDDGKVTSCAVVCLSELVLSVEQQLSADDFGSCFYPYHMITGCSNGSFKLWRSMPAQSLSSDTNWDLVGVLNSEQGPIMAVSASSCCRKIATTTTTNYPNYSSTLNIWECMHFQSADSFMLEDKLCFDREIVAINWLRLGNGQLLLAVCLRNELRIYASRRRGGQDILKREKPLEVNAWVCIAVNSSLPAISDFLWAPKGTAIIVHDEYFSLFSHLLLPDNVVSNNTVRYPIFGDSGKPTMKIIRGQYQSQAYVKMKNDEFKSTVNAESCQGTRIRFWSMSDIAEVVGGSLPLFHPEALLINLSSGNWKRAFIALRHLIKHIASSNLSKQGHDAKMSSNIIPPVPLSCYLEGPTLHSSTDKSFEWSSSQLQTGSLHFTSSDGYDAPETALTSSSSRSEFNDFIESLERLYNYSHITKDEKMQALALIDLLQEVSNPQSTSAYGSLDEPGRRFWVAVRFQQLYFAQRFSRLPLVEEFVATSGVIGWAFHSDCHDTLFNSLLSTEPSWEEMRSMGVGFWYSNVTQLRVKMERLARQQYMKKKDPKACILLYTALNRFQVLAGLFKISKDEKDKPLAGFLSRNFQEEKNKAAALKNAYVLMGKHQLELAVAFFLLGGDASSAISLCSKNLGDEQLALVICRLVEGYGGPLECNLISKYLLPSAVSKGDFWMASFLEWVLGNYSRSFSRMLGVEMDSEVNISVLSSSQASFLDPSIGQYCLMLATKTSMKNAIGEVNAAVLCQWAALMVITSFSRCGLPLEALDSLPSSVNIIGGSTHGRMMHNPTCNLPIEMVKPYKSSSNWISEGMYCHVISHCKLYLAMQYISNMLREHPSCNTDRPSFGVFIDNEVESQGFEKSLKDFQDNLNRDIAYLQQKFSLVTRHLISMVVLSLHHNGLGFVGHHILQDYFPEFLSQERSNQPDKLFLCRSNLLFKATEEIYCLYVKYVAAACRKCTNSKYFISNNLAGEGGVCWLASWGFSNQGIEWAFWCLRAMLQLFLRSYSKDYLKLLSSVLSLFEYHILFASAWFQKNFQALTVTVRPILLSLMRGSGAYEIKMEDLNRVIAEIVGMLVHDPPCVDLDTLAEINGQKQDRSGAVPDDMRRHIMSTSLWVHMSKFLEHKLSRLSEVLDESCSSLSLPVLELNKNELQLSSPLVEFLKLVCANMSFYCSKQFATYLLQEVNLSKKTDLFYLLDGLFQPGAEDNNQMGENRKLLGSGNNLLDFEQLWHICTDRKIICGALLPEYRRWLLYFKQKSSSGWSDAYLTITREFESEETSDKEDRLDSSSHASGSPLACLSPDDHPFKTYGDKDLHDSKRIIPFQNPKEIYKRNGELLEALCINSLDECEAAIASNRKGIIFFNWEDGDVSKDNSEYIWGEADWPHDGWAESVSTPVPTYVSAGVSLGSKKGAQLGIGGATIGLDALARPGKDFTGGGAFGIPGYAGVGASSLGWGIQESFDEFLDPPATMDNIRTRAFASHPSRPLFLVGSSNTHIYLWEFGKNLATATYGVLPAANVPPPYPIASVSAVRFDHCGHRFATAALDGTVCTWQLEVGGRSNVHPTESSVCFNNHTADVTYVTASGSIVAAAGYSSNGVNVVVWDTLAPPATSRASIMCHEGGARSLSVFDNDIGSGSISPLILTGGKNGDVGLHDFRYIATGRTKKHKHSETGESNTNTSSSVDMRSKTGDQNRNGMLWYIPKAHSGSVTKISTIPNSSFFLTGSNDGDVKLWDAKKAKLVFHWPRLHERQTFLQSSFGGAVRAGVTDIQIVSHGFITCGGDGLVKFVRFQDIPMDTTT